MTLTPFSVVMAVVLFTITCSICSIILPRAKGRHLWIITLVFVLCILRCLIPVEVNGAINVNCWSVYPEIFAFLRRDLFADLTIGGLLCVIWGIGSVILLFRLGNRLIFQHHLVKNKVSFTENAHLNQLGEVAAKAVSCSAPVHVYTTSDYAYPLMIGFLKPIILLPASCASFSDEEIVYILRHEIGHFLGRDLWIKLAFQFLVCLMWWNPAVYLLRRSISQLLELRCDRIACRSMTETERTDYTAVLLQVLHSDNFINPTKAISAGFAGHSNKAFFKQRIHLLLSNVSARTSRRLTVTTLVVCLLLYLGSYAFIVQPAALPPMDKEHHMVVVSPETAYLVPTEDGNYEMWVNGSLYITISPETAKLPPFNELPIKP